jgi:branched-chain amino acid aminotransferase
LTQRSDEEDAMAEPEFKKAPLMWLDGAMVPWDTGQVHVCTMTVQYGVGVFEGIRAYPQQGGGTAIFRLREHVRRMLKSARALGLALRFTEEDLVEACLAVTRESGMDALYLRPTIVYGAGSMGLGALSNPLHVAVAGWSWGRYLGEEGIRKGTRARTSTWQRLNGRSFLPKAKVTGQYVNSVMAKREALLAGFDEAILLDEQGLVAEASGENVFMVEDGLVLTAPRSAPILDGITRDAVIHLAADLGIPVREESFSRVQLYGADEAFLTGTAAEITPVREVDSRTVGSGEVGKVTRALQDLFFQTVRGANPRHAGWLTPVGPPPPNAP